MEKQINNQSLELKATQDDLAKAKSALEATRAEVETLTAQRDEARAAAAASTDSSPDLVQELERLTKELSHVKDDLAANSDMLNLTKASLSEMSTNHAVEIEENAKARAEEVTKLRAAHDAEMTTLVTQKTELLVKLSDLEGELATVKASIAAGASSPKVNGNGNGTARPSSPTITNQELQQLHEAHNLRLNDLQAEYDRVLKIVKEDLEATKLQADALQSQVERKAQEIHYLEEGQDESNGQ